MYGTSKNDNLDNVPDIVRAQTDKGFMSPVANLSLFSNLFISNKIQKYLLCTYCVQRKTNKTNSKADGCEA